MIRQSNSHPATKQDLWVLDKLPELQGTFCELGAFDGLRHSNTLLLEKYGWHGTLIEACSQYYELCKYNRPNAHCVHAAIGDGEPKTLVVGSQYSGLIEYMPQAWIEEHHKRGNQIFIVDTEPLAAHILKVDYLSLDTEGSEYVILKTGWNLVDKHALSQ